MMLFQKKSKKSKSQLEFGIESPTTPDRNFAEGGRSFYFFDFDDNVMNLPTLLFLFHTETGDEKAISTREFSLISHELGKLGFWKDYEIRLDEQTGTFRRFRHHHFNLWERIKGKKQPLVEDLVKIIKENEQLWKGPSWNFFWHAVHNSRPLSIITARGHRPQTIKEAIEILLLHRHISRRPNYLSVYPVSNSDIRVQLGDSNKTWHTAKLKQEAIKFSVHEAFKVYGQNPHHRFGMSDDDPVNIKLIVDAMQDLKKTYPENSFFVIDTHKGQLSKREIVKEGVQSPQALAGRQLNLFND